MLAGQASWEAVDEALESHAAFLARFAAEQDVQTNEVRRAWALLPGLLSLGARRVDLLELVGALAQAGREGPLAWLSLEAPRDDREFGATALELTTWPGGETRRLARVDFHCAWLAWP